MGRSGKTLGELEQLVLLAVLRVNENAYGVTIHRELQLIARRKTSLNAIYSTLERLEEKGYVSSWLGEPTPQRGGRVKRHFKLTATGAEALGRALGALEALARGVTVPVVAL